MPGSPFFSPFSASLCSPVRTAYYFRSPPGCLHATPGHSSHNCRDAVIIAHLPGYRFEGAGTTGWLARKPQSQRPSPCPRVSPGCVCPLSVPLEVSASWTTAAASPAQPSPFPQPPATPLLLPRGWGNEAPLRAV